VRSGYKKENDIDAASKDIKLESKYYINDDIEKPNKFVLAEDSLEMLQKTLNKFDSLTYPDSNTIEKSKTSLVTPSSRFESIGFARYLASVHIVMGHLYQAGHLPGFHNFSTFGFTWVPWFFLLSGFILSTAEAQRSKKQHDALDYVLRRLQTIYPTYLLGIFISIITAGILKGPQSLPPSVDMFMYIFLLQSWVPSLVEKGCIYLTQCWFLTCLVFYWTIFFHIQSFINKLNPKDLLYLVIITSLILPILYHLSAFGQQDWYNDHKYLRSSEGVDVAVLILKYNPLAYLHIFTLGCCLPQIQRMIQSFTYFKYAAPYMASVAYASMLMLFLYSSGDILQGFKLGMRLGAISSLQSLLLLGLCNEQDWLAYLFSSPVLSRLGDISFSQYVFQFLVWEWYESITHNTVADIRFFLLLFTTSVLISAVITPFNNRENLSRLFVLASTYLIVYSVCQPLLSAPDVQSHIKYATPVYNPPAYFNDTPVVFNIKGTIFVKNSYPIFFISRFFFF
jgi:peptidoglycan/LPS O-acetylase OafA/YrhL